MAMVVVTEELYGLLVAAFRASPGNISNASRQARCGRDLAKRAWEKGWPHLHGGMNVQEYILHEARLARAKMLEEQAAREAASRHERESARLQAVEARKSEGQMVTLARGAALQSLALVAQMIQGARSFATLLRQQLEAEAAKPASNMKPDEIVTILGRCAQITHRLNSSAHLAMQMERLHLGDPAHMAGVISEDKEALLLEEAEVQIEAANQALQAAKRAAVPFTVIPGGKDSGHEATG